MNKVEDSMLTFEPIRNNARDHYLISIGNYIIQKIREEDLRRDNNFFKEIEEANERQTLIEEEIKAKIGITELILNNRDILMNLEDFYEEDCQFSLLTWACDIYKRSKMQRNSKSCLSLDYYENINKDFFNKTKSLNNNVEILLFNILNIFEQFPIKPDDLKSLNFIEKLKVIKKDMKTQNKIIYQKIKNLIKFWKKMIKLFNKQKNKLISEQNEINLNKKRLREETNLLEREINKKFCGIKEENDNSFSNLSIYETDSLEQNEIKKKNVSWKNDDLLVEKLEFDPKDAPSSLLP